MFNSIKLTGASLKAAKPMIAATFPTFKGRKVSLEISERSMDLTSYWCEGDKTEYKLVELSTGRILPIPQNGTMYDKVKVPAWTPKQNVAVVAYHRSGADYQSITITLHPADAKTSVLAIEAA